jgi:hypothetical protein
MRLVRKLAAVTGALALLLGGTAPVSAVAASGRPTLGGFASDGVDYVGHVPLNNDTAGARILGDYLYVTTSRDLRIYDISDPVAPQLTGTLVFPQTVYFAQEDPDTNGKILLIADAVIDVEDKSNPTVIARHSANSHTISCVLRCRWAYASNGMIVDLRDPSDPKVLERRWTEDTPVSNSHDVTEVAPGMVVTSSQPILLLDARRNPARPRIRALGSNDDQRFIHGNLWPRNMRDRYLLVGGESTGPTCNSPSAAFMTWDTRGWQRTQSFRMVDEYRVQQGSPTSGDAPANLFCTHWFDTHPRYRNGGLVAMAWYEHGVRFLEINARGRIEEVGYFIPYGGSTSAAYWATDEIVYSLDYNRGFDILRWTGED